MKKSILLFAICVFFINIGINAQNKINGNGNVVTETRTTADYDGIKISGSFDVDLVAGKEGKITLKGEKNILDVIEVEVEDNQLKINVKKMTNIQISNGKKIQITVPFEKISSLNLVASGNVTAKDVIKTDDLAIKLVGSGNFTLPVNTKNLEVHVSGSGNIHLNGKTDRFTTKLSGSGDIDAAKLDSKIVEANVSGSGNSKVTCNESLTARVSGSGNIKYAGNPEKKDLKTSGSGSISKV